MNEEYEEIDLLELAQRILSRWKFVVLLVVLSAGAAYGVTKQLITPIYEASTTVFIGKESTALASLNLADLQVGNQLVTDYRELIKTNLVTQEVIEELALITTVKDLQEALEVGTIKDSRFMHITFKDADPKVAAKVADKISVILTEKAEQIVGVKNILIVDFAEVPEKPVSPSTPKNVAVAGILGFVLALIIIFIELMLANTLEKDEDIEKELGLPLLGSIPVFEGGSRS